LDELVKLSARDALGLALIAIVDVAITQVPSTLALANDWLDSCWKYINEPKAKLTDDVLVVNPVYGWGEMVAQELLELCWVEILEVIVRHPDEFVGAIANAEEYVATFVVREASHRLCVKRLGILREIEILFDFQRLALPSLHPGGLLGIRLEQVRDSSGVEWVDYRTSSFRWSIKSRQATLPPFTFLTGDFPRRSLTHILDFGIH
jgi:hypothetical protein